MMDAMGFIGRVWSLGHSMALKSQRTNGRGGARTAKLAACADVRLCIHFCEKKC